MLCRYYKVNLDFEAALNMPYGFLHYLYYNAVQEAKTEAGRQAQHKREMEYELENNLGAGGGNYYDRGVRQPYPNQQRQGISTRPYKPVLRRNNGPVQSAQGKH